MDRVCFIGAHIDDIEAGCGGVLINYCDKKDIHINCIITNSDDQLGGAPSARMHEQDMVLSKLGGNKIHIRYFTKIYTIDEMVGQIDILSPMIIYAPYEFDTHQDHIRAARVGLSVSRKKDRILFSYHSGSSYNFVPNIFSRINKNRKELLLKIFKSQVNTNRISIGRIIAQNRYMGTFLSGDDVYAEGFHCHRFEYKI